MIRCTQICCQVTQHKKLLRSETSLPGNMLRLCGEAGDQYTAMLVGKQAHCKRFAEQHVNFHPMLLMLCAKLPIRKPACCNACGQASKVLKVLADWDVPEINEVLQGRYV